jgi:2-keto-4-pentenoate hydratase/2-oxohepta-3-ene-1,7-dioic acid hydratase in catechol pathway
MDAWLTSNYPGLCLAVTVEWTIYSAQNTQSKMTFTNYASYNSSEDSTPRVGHYDLENGTVQPLSFLSGTPLTSLYQVIEAGETNIRAYDEAIPVSSTRILAPFTGRDILAVGKNYFDHAKEFNNSGFDSSDKVDVPSHPVIFTKRATSIIADGDTIFPHPGFTETMDYEGEIGVVLGKAAFRVSEQDAMDYVWGYTIINDMTARERQRDHKQFFIGKSADTFCPMVRKTASPPGNCIDWFLRAQLLFQLLIYPKCLRFKLTSMASSDSMQQAKTSYFLFQLS